MRKTSLFVLGLCVLKAVPSKISWLVKSPIKFPWILIKNLDYGLMMFFLTINGIFKVSHVVQLELFNQFLTNLFITF